MMLRSNVSAALAIAVGCALAFAVPANALGLKECSDKYSAAKTAGTAGKTTFTEFMKSDCGADAKPVAAPAAGAAPVAAAPAKSAEPTRAEKRRAAKEAKAAAAPAAAPAAPAAPAAAAPAPKAPAPAPAAAAAPSTAVFPAVIGDAHKDKAAAKGRMATCLDQYRANKATNGNGGLRWIQKGGGYYSECNKRLKA